MERALPEWAHAGARPSRSDAAAAIAAGLGRAPPPPGGGCTSQRHATGTPGKRMPRGFERAPRSALSWVQRLVAEPGCSHPRKQAPQRVVPDAPKEGWARVARARTQLAALPGRTPLRKLLWLR